MRQRPSGFTWLWLGWLWVFLMVEIPAAIRPKKGATFTEHCRRWFPGWRLWILAAFLVALFCHLVFGASAWWLLTAAPLVAVIVYSVFWEGGA